VTLAWSPEERGRRLIELEAAFRPSAPVDNEDLFSGRVRQLADVQEAIGALGEHAVIFGERGVGKTSLAATCADIALHAGKIAIRINCDQSDNYVTIWQKVVDEFPVVIDAAPADRKAATESATERATDVFLYPETTLGPSQVRVAFRHITAVAPLVVFLDEFDQLSDSGTLGLISNTIKLLSDQIEDVTLIPVGVGDDVDELIAGHQSIQRNLVQVRMPRMNRGEIESILDKGLAKLGMSIDANGRGFIRIVPRGLPQYAHMLAQEGARQALLNDQTTITISHVVRGMQSSFRKLDRSLKSAFDKATYTGRDSNYADVLYACAWGTPDEEGYFSPKSIEARYSMIVGKPRHVGHYNPHLVALSEGRGEILSRKGPQRARRYRFSDPLMEPYVLFRGIFEGRIDPYQLLDADGDSSEPEQPS
jgi:AAA ATPase domain